MVTRFVSVPEYPANANHCQNEVALVGAWLKTGHRDGEKPPTKSRFPELGVKTAGSPSSEFIGKLGGRKTSAHWNECWKGPIIHPPAHRSRYLLNFSIQLHKTRVTASTP